MADLSAGDARRGRRALERCDLPPGPDCPPGGETDRGPITPPRLPPEAWFPAGHEGYRVTRVTVGGGLSLRVVERGDPAAPPVLLLHGWACMAYSFATLFGPLAAAGHRVILVELPGHAVSDKPLDEEAYTLAAMTDAVEQAMAALGVSHADVVGHSMGTAIALELVRRNPEAVQRLVLISPLGLDRIRVTALAHGVSPRMMMRMLPAGVPRAAVKAILQIVHGKRRQPIERDVDHYWSPTAFPAFGFAMIALLRRFDWRALPPARLAAVRTPTLVITGERDPLVRHRAVSRNAAVMPQATVVVMPDVGHVPLAEAAECVEKIVGFLAPAGA